MKKIVVLLLLIVSSISLGAARTYACTNSYNPSASCTKTVCNLCKGSTYLGCDCYSEPSTCKEYQWCCNGNQCASCGSSDVGGTTGYTIGTCESTGPPGGDNPTAAPDVSPTPTPTSIPGTLTARAVQVSSSDTSCTAVANSATGLSGTVFGFTASSADQPTPLTQSQNQPVTFSNEPVGWYTLASTPPSQNAFLVQVCEYYMNAPAGNSLSGNLVGGDEFDWILGYTNGTPWVQTNGGDVYASGTLRSYIPYISPRVFNAVSSGGYPGIVTYGTTYAFDSASAPPSGGTLVSSKNWLVNATRATTDYYDLFYHRFGAPTTTDNASFNNLAAVTQPAGRATPYYISGDMATSGDWSVGSGQSIVFLVDGNLTIGGNINIVPNSTGFVAFIVHGNITVDSSVGTTALSTAPNVEGVYIATKADGTGTIITGTSTALATARLVGKGMFIADNFTLQRDLDSYGGNTGSSPELFVYNPQLLLTMPDSMKELPVTWQEVAP